MTDVEHVDAAPRARPIDTVLKAALVAVVAVRAIDEVARVWRRATRSQADWWERVERRERRQLHDAQLGFLLRRSRRR